MYLNKASKYQSGIGVIEVMVAAVIFALGILALIQLQSSFFQNSSAAQSRALAATLAEDKLEDLRSFQSDTAGFDFLDIDDNAGGAIASGAITLGNTNYTLSWLVDGYAYNSGTLTTVAPTAASVAHKSVVINVAWTDVDGAAQTYTLDAVINSNSGEAGGALADATGGSGEKPTVPHIELAAPDVLRVKVKNPPPEGYEGTTAEWNALSDANKAKEYAKNLGRCNVETYGATEAPDPDLNNNPTLDNVIVRFASTKYQKYNPCTYDYASDVIDSINTSIDYVVKLQEEEFVTINCECELAASGFGYDQSGASVAKALTGTKTGATNQQDDFCDLCCRDHHENTTGDYLCGSGANPENCLDPWRTAGTDYTSSDHKHFASSNLAAVAGVGDTYNEVCRIKRVDGFYRVVPDWRMIAHNVLVEDDFGASAAISSYESYLGTQINSALQGNSVTVWSYASAAVPSDDEQMASRSIYLDYHTVAEITDAAPATSGDEVDIAIDFYEYKTTQISDWTTDKSGSIDTQTISPCDPANSTSDACTDSPTITAIVGDNALEKGVFRYDSPTGDIDIVSTMGTSNSGVVSEPAIDTADQTTLAASYAVAFGAGPPAPVRSVILVDTGSASINCPSTWKVGPTTYTLTTENIADWGTMSLSCSPSSGNAATCEQYSSDTNNVSVTVNMGTAALSCTYSNGSTYACGSISGLSGGSRLDVDGTFTCSVQSSKSGSNLGCDLVCN